MRQTLVTTDGTVQATGRFMREMVDRYYTDMAPYAGLSIIEAFDLIKSIPYREDHPAAEVLMRPSLTLSQQGRGGDCDDKAIAFASYCRLVGIPFRFVAARLPTRKDLHHVYTECYVYGEWIIADPTYRFNVFGREREPYKERVII